MLKKIMIVLGVIILWECRDDIIPGIESVVSYVIATGSSFIESVQFIVYVVYSFIKSVMWW